MNKALNKVYYRLVQTRFGCAGLVQYGSRLASLFLPRGTEKSAVARIRKSFPGSQPAQPSRRRFEHDLRRYFEGQRVLFRCPIDWSGLGRFDRKILKTLARVPYGRVISYGELARRAGYRGAARAVGSALSRNPLPLVIPCHRVVRGDGGLGGYSAGRRWKKKLLNLESVTNRS